MQNLHHPFIPQIFTVDNVSELWTQHEQEKQAPPLTEFAVSWAVRTLYEEVQSIRTRKAN